MFKNTIYVWNWLLVFRFFFIYLFIFFSLLFLFDTHTREISKSLMKDIFLETVDKCIGFHR